MIRYRYFKKSSSMFFCVSTKILSIKASVVTISLSDFCTILTLVAENMVGYILFDCIVLIKLLLFRLFCNRQTLKSPINIISCDLLIGSSMLFIVSQNISIFVFGILYIQHIKCFFRLTTISTNKHSAKFVIKFRSFLSL